MVCGPGPPLRVGSCCRRSLDGLGMTGEGTAGVKRKSGRDTDLVPVLRVLADLVLLRCTNAGHKDPYQFVGFSEQGIEFSRVVRQRHPLDVRCSMFKVDNMLST